MNAKQRRGAVRDMLKAFRDMAETEQEKSIADMTAEMLRLESENKRLKEKVTMYEKLRGLK